MIKRIFLFFVSVIFMTGHAFAQYNYSWKTQGILVCSKIEFQSNDTPYGFQLKGNGISIDFATLGGMEGISGLAPSLDSYAESFGYKLNGKAREFLDVKTLAVARIDGRKDGQNLILCLMATKDFKKHFTCEILFSDNQQDNVETIIKGISFDEDSSNDKISVIEEDADKIQLIDKQEKDQENQSQQKHQNSIEIGALAIDFTLSDINGKPVNLSSFRGKTVLLDFWGTWCAPCIQSIPKLKELYAKYGGSEFEIISIANDVNADKWKNTVSNNGMNWINVIDQDEKVCKQYQIKAYPSLLLIDKDGNFIALRTNDGEVDEYLNQSGLQSSNQVAQENQLQQGQQNQTSVGGLAIDFTLFDIIGKPISLSSFKGKTVMLDFWGTWCAPCIQSIPKLKELYAKYGGSEFEIVSIANDVNADKWKNAVSNNGMNWTNVIDQEEKVCKQYQIKAYPSLFLIDKDGKFIAVRTNDGEVDEYLNQSGSQSTNHISQETQVTNQQQHVSTYQPNNEGVLNSHKDGTPVQKLTWQLLSTYSPDGYFILDEFYKTPTSYGGQTQSGDDDFAKWIDGQSEEDIVKSLNTVVHEMDHGFTGRVYLKILKEANRPVEDGSYSAFYLGNKETRLVKHTNVYVSSEINSVFPAGLITSRYETYVYPSEPIMGSQQSGVYGLLDEWNAYYNGTKTSFDLYSFYKEKRDDASGWAEFFTDYYGTYYAYLEFKSYILVYMMLAQKNYPQLYQGFMNNKDLLYSLKKTDEIWRTLIINFKELRKKIIADLTAKGLDVKEKDGFLFINGTGSGNFSEIYNKFQEELKKPEYQGIAISLGFVSAGGPEF